MGPRDEITRNDSFVHTAIPSYTENTSGIYRKIIQEYTGIQ